MSILKSTENSTNLHQVEVIRFSHINNLISKHTLILLIAILVHKDVTIFTHFSCATKLHTEQKKGMGGEGKRLNNIILRNDFTSAHKIPANQKLGIEV